MLLAVNLLQWWTANRHKNSEPLEVAAAKASGGAQ
jgi:sulfate transport system permease protein